ncbi:MAG TPA: hypothetical protein VGN69_09330 [Solirubrobacteraceae bacterium]|nr:hypothetical protein [Solirubrobacteraceae bacterium]
MSSPRDGASERQTLMVRRGIALGGGLLVVILLGLAIKGCLASQKRDALNSYNNSVQSILADSDSQVAKPLFSLLASSRGKSPLDVEVQINNYRDVAQEEVRRAQGLKVPNGLGAAQRNLLQGLDFRAEAVGKIGTKIRTALATSPSSADAAAVIAGEMEVLLASDVIFLQRFAPLVSQALSDNSIKAQPPNPPRFLADLAWLSTATVQSRLGTGSGPSTPTGKAAPGTHGHALTGVSVGSTTLAPSPTVNRLPAGTSPDFSVKVANGGSNDELNVKVDITVRGSGAPITASKTIDRTKAGTESTVVVALGKPPPKGTPLRVEAFVEPVPGEKTISNNRQRYTVVFG